MLGDSYKMSDYWNAQVFSLKPARVSDMFIEPSLTLLSADQSAYKMTFDINLAEVAKFSHPVSAASLNIRSDFRDIAHVDLSTSLHAPSRISAPTSPYLLGDASTLGHDAGFSQLKLGLNSPIGLVDPAAGSYSFLSSVYDYEFSSIRQVIRRTKNQIHRLFIAGVERIVGTSLKLLQEAQKNRARLAFRERILHRDKVKLFNRPFLLIPRSIHPNVSVAL